MTKEELKQIESFLEDMDNSDDEIEVMTMAWEWLRRKYHTEGPKNWKIIIKSIRRKQNDKLKQYSSTLC